MRYLAKVERAAFLGNAVLQLLARQVSEYLWETLSREKTVETELSLGVGDSALIIVQLDAQHQVVGVEDAVPWVLHLVDTFLSQGITPQFLAEEAERAEQWRQSLTLESQEVERRALETAARRDEIQELEKSLKLKREELKKHEKDVERLTQEAATRQQEIKAQERAIRAAWQKLQAHQSEIAPHSGEQDPHESTSDWPD